MVAWAPRGSSLKDVPRRSAQIAASSLPNAHSLSLVISPGTRNILIHVCFIPVRMAPRSLELVTAAAENLVHSSMQ